jgi:hypothetical protein
LHQIFFLGLPSGENSPRERRRKKKKEKNWWEVVILLFHPNCKFSIHNGSPNFVSTIIPRELQKKNNKIILLILLSHCGEAGTLILILCYGNWHKVYRDVPYVMSCGSPLLSIINVHMWVNENKKPKDPGKGCFSALHTFGRSLFRVVWPTFLSSTYPLIHPDLPPPSSKQSVCLGKDRAVSRVQSQGQKFFDHSTCSWYSALNFFHKAKSETTKEKKYPPNFHFSQPRFPKLCHCSYGVYMSNPDSATVDYHNMVSNIIKETLHTHTRLSKCWNIQIGIVRHLYVLQLIKYFSTIGHLFFLQLIKYFSTIGHLPLFCN